MVPVPHLFARRAAPQEHSFCAKAARNEASACNTSSNATNGLVRTLRCEITHPWLERRVKSDPVVSLPRSMMGSTGETVKLQALKSKFQKDGNALNYEIGIWNLELGI